MQKLTYGSLGIFPLIETEHCNLGMTWLSSLFEMPERKLDMANSNTAKGNFSLRTLRDIRYATNQFTSLVNKILSDTIRNTKYIRSFYGGLIAFPSSRSACSLQNKIIPKGGRKICK